ncbi:hypothetical protein J3459_016593 [Metarhizium acridum]|uniref:uncharacterized protein n=1 Tax=Metarhizium acridum TaxID=92637 RepID=UPI001C6C3707|nr:hypothetical protein J3459_016593 [Metarhizium acridum]KAG8413438.1 hypothetical protein J3458_012997 [Metarhizium acridum]
MAFVYTIIGMGSMVAMMAGAGFSVGAAVMGAISLTVNRPVIFNPNNIIYSFKLGLDGAGTNEGFDPLRGAGGRAPKILVFDNQGKQLGQTKKQIKCGDGEDHCVEVVKKIKKQPSYALLLGLENPICLASASVSYPSGDRYAWVGNWAHTCDKPWYFSDIDAHHDNGSVKLLCAWLGQDGYKENYSTGIRIHFPEFAKGFAGNGNNASYYCRDNNTALAFYNNQSPKFFNGDNVQEHKVNEKDKKNQKKKKGKRSAGMKAPSVRSHHAAHSAKLLCDSTSSVGPSLVSVPERSFCHMPDKVLYRFCEDVAVGACWDHEAHAFAAKGPRAMLARAELPDMDFEEPTVWGGN